MQAILPSTQPRGSHAFHPALTNITSPSIDDDANNSGTELPPESELSIGVSNAFSEGSGSHNADDRMSIDLVIDTPPSPPLDARLSSKTPISFRASALASLTTTPSHLSIASLHSAPGSANSSSAGSRKGKRKLSALADQDMASLTSSKKKGL